MLRDVCESDIRHTVLLRIPWGDIAPSIDNTLLLHIVFNADVVCLDAVPEGAFGS